MPFEPTVVSKLPKGPVQFSYSAIWLTSSTNRISGVFFGSFLRANSSNSRVDPKVGSGHMHMFGKNAVGWNTLMTFCLKSSRLAHFSRFSTRVGPPILVHTPSSPVCSGRFSRRLSQNTLLPVPPGPPTIKQLVFLETAVLIRSTSCSSKEVRLNSLSPSARRSVKSCKGEENGSVRS